MVFRDMAADRCATETCKDLLAFVPSPWGTQSETFPAAQEGGVPRSFMDLAIDERAKLLKDRLKKYCQKVRSRFCTTVSISQGIPSGKLVTAALCSISIIIRVLETQNATS